MGNKLFLSSEYELISLNGTVFMGQLLFLSDLFLRTFHSLPADLRTIDLEEAEGCFCELLSFLSYGKTGSAEVKFDPLGLMSTSSDPWYLGLEIMGLRHAISEWVDKGHKPASSPDISVDRLLGEHPPGGFATYYFYERLQQAPAYPEAHEGQLRRVHESDSLLALAWSEVWYALDFKIRARICPYCSKVFPVPANNPRKNNCLSKGCKKSYEIERHG
jgi:hypothetical protein